MRAILLPLVLLFPALVHAQEGRPVNCRFLSFGGTDDTASVLALSDKGAEVTCPLPSNELSKKVVCFAKQNTIGFFSSSDKAPVATATIPAGLNTALLIFVQAPKKPEDVAAATPSWRVFVIEDSPKNFPDGGAFVANFYNKDIRFIIGEHKGMLHAAGSHGYAMPAVRDSFNMAPVVFELFQDEKWRVANESALRFLPGMRYLIFTYVDPVSGRPRISTCQDFTPPAAVQQATP